MSQYTDEDVRAVGLAIDATMPLHGSEDEQIDYAARAVLDAVAPAIAARALREAADRTIAETVCCDEYEATKSGVARPKYAHHICYWGAAHAEALRSRADEIAP